MAEKRTVYVETSVVSYLTSRPSRDILVAAHQQLTNEWWHDIMPVYYAPFISEVVLEEASRGDPEAAARRLDALRGIPSVGLLPEVDGLAEIYLQRLPIPDKARIDAIHIAVAVVHILDYVVSWNCAHIAGGEIRRKLHQVNTELSLHTPVICTPEELMEV